MTRSAPSALERAWGVLSPPRESELASYPIDLDVFRNTMPGGTGPPGSQTPLVPAVGETLAADNRRSFFTNGPEAGVRCGRRGLRRPLVH